MRAHYPEEVRVNIVQAVIGELIAILGYALLGSAVYKLFQIASDLGEIKALLQKTGGNPAIDHVTPPRVGDSATEYAQNLLRAVNAESRRSENEPVRSAESVAGCHVRRWSAKFRIWPATSPADCRPDSCQLRLTVVFNCQV